MSTEYYLAMKLPLHFYLQLHILKPLMKLTYWSEESLGTRVVLTGTAHMKFEKKYLINGMNDWVEMKELHQR